MDRAGHKGLPRCVRPRIRELEARSPFDAVYLLTDMLRRLDLHVPAATLNKYCSTESLRNLTQVPFDLVLVVAVVQADSKATAFRTLSCFTLHVVDVGKESSNRRLTTVQSVG